MLVQVMLPTAVVLSGLAAGVLVGTQLGGWPLLQALSPERYVHAHALFATRYDPFMPFCLIGTVLLDLGLALTTGDPGVRALASLAALLAGGTVVISVVKNVPVNRWVRSLDPDRLPADFNRLDPRPAWGRWNRVRSWLSVAALLANAVAVGALL